MSNEVVVEIVDGVNIALVKLDYVREQGSKPNLQEICKKHGIVNFALVQQIAEVEKWDSIRRTYLNREVENVVTETKLVSAKNNLDMSIMSSNLFKVSYQQLFKNIQDGTIVVGVDDVTKLMSVINKGELGKFENLNVDNSKNIILNLSSDPENLTLEQIEAFERKIKNGNTN